MPRAARLSTSPLAAVRRYFGLHQFELAAYLGRSPELAKHQEAGRRRLGAATAQRLLPLLQALPAPPEPAPAPTATSAPLPAAPAAGLALPAAAPLLARLDYCQHHARRLRRELSKLETTLEYARRWQAALPALLAQAPDERARQWLLRRQEQAAADLDAEASAAYHLLRLRAEALETEAAALAALLPPAR
jgi:transcriptional regulator with XRE-family HTH domain